MVRPVEKVRDLLDGREEERVSWVRRIGLIASGNLV